MPNNALMEKFGARAESRNILHEKEVQSGPSTIFYKLGQVVHANNLAGNIM